jgi:hypothetical protein
MIAIKLPWNKIKNPRQDQTDQGKLREHLEPGQDFLPRIAGGDCPKNNARENRKPDQI